MKNTKIIILVLIIILIVFTFVFVNSFKNNTNIKDRYPTEVIIETSLGDITIELYDLNAPITVANFLNYVEEGFYENTIFHRVIPNFMIQGGGFLVSGDKKDTHSPIVLETTKETGLSNIKGTISMARTIDANSATSQFFINTFNNTSLDYKDDDNPGYAVFGKVTSGMDVVSEIENKETEIKFNIYKDWPVKDIIIKKIYVKK